jgi:predicted nuclease with TOPRIM domain
MEKVHISTETRNHVPIDEKYSELVSKHQILIQKVQQIETEKVQLQSKLESIESLYSELIIGKENVDKQNRSLSKKYNQLTIQKSIVYQSQIIQLKRQLDKYKQVANKKELFVYSAQEQVFMCLEKARSLESLISDKPALEGLIKRLQALSKHITRSERDHIESIEPNAFHFISDFLHGHKEITMNDVCSGIVPF